MKELGKNQLKKIRIKEFISTTDQISTYIDEKYNECVHLSGDQQINGIKTFIDNVILSNTVQFNKNIIGGNESSSFGNNAFALGSKVQAYGDQSHAEGDQCEANGTNAYAQGFKAKAYGNTSYSIGSQAIASVDYAYVWSSANGDRSKDYVVSDENRTGTYNIDPNGGISGFYIGNDNLYNIIDKSIDKKIVLDSQLLSSSVNGVQNSAIYESVSNLSDMIEALGISSDPAKSINIDAKTYLTDESEASWLYMCKIDVNVYLSSIDNNYGDALAIPIKGLRFLNTVNFNNINSEHLISVGTGFTGNYTCFDSNNDEIVKSASDISSSGIQYLYDTRCESDPNRMYKWCTIYRCDRELNCDDVLSNINFVYVSQSNKNSMVVNALCGDINTMDFCFSDEPFVMTKDYDYLIVLRNKYVENIHEYTVFDPESISSVSYFRCTQFKLKDPGATGAGNRVDHGNAWIGWNSVSSLSNELKTHTMDWVWHSQTSNGNQEHAHSFVGPMNFVMDKDAYRVLFEKVITKKIADSLYANKTQVTYDNQTYLLGKLKIHEYSSDSAYDRYVGTQQNANEFYIIDQTDGLNVYDSVIKNVGYPEEDTDAATVSYVNESIENKINQLKSQVSALSVTEDGQIDTLTQTLSILIESIKNL